MSRRLLPVLLPALVAAGLVATEPVPAAGQTVVTAVVEADISAALDDLEVDSTTYRVVAADYEQARATRREAEARLRSLATEERSLAGAAARAGATARLAESESDRWTRRVARLAVRAYIDGGADDDVEAAGLDPTYAVDERRALFVTEVDAEWQRTLEAAQEALVASRRARDELHEQHGDVVAEQERTTTARREAVAEERRLRPTVQNARATAVVAGSDLTLVALDAYLRAALDVGGELPGCGIPWWLLAGIGRVESGHGTFATSTLDPAGTARPAIIGIALDGSSNTAVITDTDGGALDGDQRSDRAVGPMQFIPSTWSRYASDGNGDGLADPQNLYDAAHAAARYLCTAGGDLTNDPGRRQAIFSYNHSQSYVAKVLGFTTEYTGLLV